MTKSELTQAFLTRLSNANLSASLRSQLEEYLAGVTDTAPRLPSYNGYLPYDTISFLTGQFQSPECGETAKRAYRVLARLTKNRFLRDSQWNSHAFKEFSEGGLDEELVVEFISQELTDLKKGYRWRYGEQLTRVKKQMEGPKSGLTGLAELYAFYGELADRLIRKNVDKGPTIVTFTLLVLGSWWYRKDEERSGEYIQMTTELLYSALKSLYREKGSLEGKNSGFLKASSLALYDRVSPDTLGMDSSDLSRVALGTALAMGDSGQAFEDAQRLCLVMLEPADGFEICHKTVEDLYRLEQGLELPERTLTELAAESLFLENFKKYGRKNAALLEECYHRDRETFLSVYHKAVEEKSRKMLSMAALLCRHEPDSDGQDGGTKNPIIAMLRGNKPQGTYRQQANLNFLTYLSVCQVKKMLEVKYRDKNVDARALYEKLGGFDDDVEFRFARNIESLDSLFVASALLYGDSQAANQFYHACLKSLYGYLLGNQSRYGMRVQEQNPCRFFLSAFLTAGPAFGREELASKEGQASLFEKLAEDFGVETVLNMTVLSGAGDDRAAFLLFASGHIEEAAALYERELGKDQDSILLYANLFYQQDIGMPIELLCRTMTNRLKTVVSRIEEMLTEREAEARPHVEALAKAKNKNAREAAERLQKKWDEGRISQAMASFESGQEMAAYVAGMFKKANRSKIPFVDELLLTSVKLKDGQAADPVLLEYYLSEYMLLKEVKVLKPCEEIRRILDENSLRELMADLYNHWMDSEAEAKQKNLLMPYAISASGADIVNLKRQIDLWTENSRGALAAFAVSAMALNGSDMTLLIVDGISKKYKNKQVKAAAEESMEKAASLLGITKEELGDRIVPNLGFGRDRRRGFDFGSRSFTGLLTPELNVELYDESGKRIKNLPKPGAKDDAAMAARSVAEYKELKKQLKTVVASQKNRLEGAIITGRSWERDKWERLFVENPVMNGFAIGLIWEEWDPSGNLIGTFRYMEDGSFNSMEEEEYELQENTRIALLHPLDVPAEWVETWEQQLSDYEIVQPLPQLSMPVFKLMPEEGEQEEISRFSGSKVYFGTVRGLMEKYDWKKTSIVDGGGYEGYYYEDEASGIGVQISFDFLYVGMANDEAVTVENMRFYKRGTVTYGSYVYDEVGTGNRVLPKDVPAKLASFVLMVGDTLAQKAI